MRTKTEKESKLKRFMASPIRVLTKARDFYVQSLNDCNDRLVYGNVYSNPIGVPTGRHVSGLPKSFSVGSCRSSSSGGDDYSELVRAASTRTLGSRIDVSQFEQLAPAAASAGVVPRSCSVGMARIDEDSPCDFSKENVSVRAELVQYPRSRSHAVPRRNVGF
ncbi:hypothetical protein NMG60_11031258 [Bertholletia excelsa]